MAADSQRMLAYTRCSACRYSKQQEAAGAPAPELADMRAALLAFAPEDPAALHAEHTACAIIQNAASGDGGQGAAEPDRELKALRCFATKCSIQMLLRLSICAHGAFAGTSTHVP